MTSQEIQHDIEAFLNAGGRITRLPPARARHRPVTRRTRPVMPDLADPGTVTRLRRYLAVTDTHAAARRIGVPAWRIAALEIAITTR